MKDKTYKNTWHSLKHKKNEYKKSKLHVEYGRYQDAVRQVARHEWVKLLPYVCLYLG